MHRNKILLIANSTWNFYNFRLNIIDALIEKGFEVVLISPQDEYLHALLELKRIRHIPLRQLDRKGTNPWQESKLFMELFQIYRAEKPQLVIHYTIKPNIYGNLAARALGIKSICVVTGLGYVFLHDTLYNKLAKLLYKKSFSKADLVLFENNDDRDLFVAQGLVPAHNSDYLNGCGVNPEHYKPLLEINHSGSKSIFTFIGRLMHDKGIIEFINAAKKLSSKYDNVEFWLVGEIDSGNPSSITDTMLCNWIETGIVKYFGQLKDVRPIIQKSDCVVLPSYREGMSRLLTEAISMEKPVISSDTPGCKQIVDVGRNGFLVPVRDTKALILAIEKFLKLTESERRSMGKAGRQKAMREFDDRLIAAQFVSLIDKVRLSV